MACPASKVTVVGGSPNSFSGTLVVVTANSCCTSTVTVSASAASPVRLNVNTAATPSVTSSPTAIVTAGNGTPSTVRVASVPTTLCRRLASVPEAWIALAPGVVSLSAPMAMPSLSASPAATV